MSTKVYVAIFAEGYYEGLIECPDERYAFGFAAGASEGASHYGSGSFGAYTLPVEHATMVDFEDSEEVAKADADFAKKMSG